MKLQSYGLHKDKSSKWNNYVNKETKGKICVCDTATPRWTSTPKMVKLLSRQGKSTMGDNSVKKGARGLIFVPDTPPPQGVHAYKIWWS